MGATKIGQFFSGSFFGILLWGTGILMSGFLPTFGDGIEFGYVSALSIFFPAVMWLSCVFTGIKTAKNGKKVFFSFVNCFINKTNFLQQELSLQDFISNKNHTNQKLSLSNY